MRGMGIVRDNNNENKGYEKIQMFKKSRFFHNRCDIWVQEGIPGDLGDLGDLGDFLVGFILTSAGLVATWVTLAVGEGQWDGHAQQQ